MWRRTQQRRSIEDCGNVKNSRTTRCRLHGMSPSSSTNNRASAALAFCGNDSYFCSWLLMKVRSFHSNANVCGQQQACTSAQHRGSNRCIRPSTNELTVGLHGQFRVSSRHALRRSIRVRLMSASRRKRTLNPTVLPATRGLPKNLTHFPHASLHLAASGSRFLRE